MLVNKDLSPADPRRVNLAEEWEVRWWCDKWGCTEVALRRAVEDVGPAAADVERKLTGAAKQVLKNTGED